MAATGAERYEILPQLPQRHAEGHKGSYGRVLILAGSREMPGAAALVGKAALRGGAGLVTVASPASVAPIVAIHDVCYLVLPLQETDAGQVASAALEGILARHADVVALGPGLGVSGELRQLVAALVERVPTTMVIDADGLNALIGQTERLRQRSAPTILTPHPGEFARLIGRSTADVQADRESLAFQFAKEHRVTLLLKGHRTIITDGTRLAVNGTGNPGMATGGSGDVLTGLTAALVGQGLDPFEATVLAAWVHGKAGDLAAEELGQVSLIATDLIEFLPRAFKRRDGMA